MEINKVEIPEALLPGDRVNLFTTPSGKIILNKTKTDGWRVGRITTAYICFDEDFNIQEV